jgi:hypothetical protein
MSQINLPKISDANAYSVISLPKPGSSAGLLPGGVNGPSLSSVRSRSLSCRPSIEDVPENESGPSLTTSSPTAESGGSSSERRGRGHSRFNLSLSSVSSALMDAMGSSSPKTTRNLRNRTVSRERRDEGNADSPRGRMLERAEAHASPHSPFKPPHSKERSVLSRFGEILKLDGDAKPKEVGDGWKEFKKGRQINKT